MRNKLALSTFCALLVSGCGLPPENPGILVATTPPGASCTLTRQGQPVAAVAPTPGIAVVEPAVGDITILCSRPGFEDAAVSVAARETGPSFGVLLYGHASVAYPPQAAIVLRPRSPVIAPR